MCLNQGFAHGCSSRFHLTDEANRNSLVWFAHVPTEANTSDYPSRLAPHPFLSDSRNSNTLAEQRLAGLLRDSNIVM